MLNPRFPAPVNTFTTRPSTRWSCLRLARVVRTASAPTARARAQSSSAAAPRPPAKATCDARSSAAAPARGMSGTCMNQSNAKIARVRSFESEFPTRLIRYELIRKLRRPGLLSQQAPASAANTSEIWPTRHFLDPLHRSCGKQLSGGNPSRGRHPRSTQGRDGKKRSTTHSDYPLKVGEETCSGSIRRAAAATPTHWTRARPAAPTIQRGPGVAGGCGKAVRWSIGTGWTIDDAATRSTEAVALKSRETA